MAPAKAAKNAQYCKKYRQKNLEEIRKNDRERKKFQREDRKYCEPKKYEEYLKKEGERKQRGMYLGFQIAVVRTLKHNLSLKSCQEISVTIPTSTEMRKLLAILINTQDQNIQFSCLTGEVACKMWYYFFGFCHVFVFDFFRVSYTCSGCFELFCMSSTCFRFLLYPKIYLGPPGTLVHTKTVC